MKVQLFNDCPNHCRFPFPTQTVNIFTQEKTYIQYNRYLLYCSPIVCEHLEFFSLNTHTKLWHLTPSILFLSPTVEPSLSFIIFLLPLTLFVTQNLLQPCRRSPPCHLGSRRSPPCITQPSAHGHTTLSLPPPWLRAPTHCCSNQNHSSVSNHYKPLSQKARSHTNMNPAAASTAAAALCPSHHPTPSYCREPLPFVARHASLVCDLHFLPQITAIHHFLALTEESNTFADLPTRKATNVYFVLHCLLQKKVRKFRGYHVGDDHLFFLFPSK